MSRDTVVLTASAGAFPGLAAALAELGVEMKTEPLLSFAPPLDWNPLDSTLTQRHRYRAIALTSPRAAQALAERIDANGVSWQECAVPVWVVGPTTEDALKGKVGRVRRPDSVSGSGETAAASLARAMLQAGVGGPVLFPCGDRRRDELPELLEAGGVQVDEVVCYRSVLATPREAGAAVLGSTVVIVASPSVAALLAEACPGPSRPLLVVTGKATADAAQAAGWSPAAAAAESSASALAAAITGLLAAPR